MVVCALLASSLSLGSFSGGATLLSAAGLQLTVLSFSTVGLAASPQRQPQQCRRLTRLAISG